MIIESLQKGKHVRATFSCKVESLDRFLREQAHQACEKNLSKTYVAVAEEDETVILGYYTVSITRIDAGELPRDFLIILILPRSTLPAQLVARLAVCEKFKKQGIGGMLLFDALRRCGNVAAEAGGVAVVVDALDEQAVNFYEQYGFQRFQPGGQKLFLPMETVRRLVSAERQREVS